MTNPGDLTLGRRLERIEKKLDRLTEHVFILKAKAGIYGACAGALLTILLDQLR